LFCWFSFVVFRGVITKEHEKLQALYKEIIGRLPDVSMTISKKC